MLTFEQLIFRQKELMTSFKNMAMHLEPWSSVNLSHGEVTTCINMIEANWKEFKTRHLEILALRDFSNEGHRYFRCRDYLNTEDNYRMIMGNALNTLALCPKVEMAPPKKSLAQPTNSNLVNRFDDDW